MTEVPISQVILTLHPNFKLPALSETPLDNAGLSCRQLDLQPHKQLQVGLLFEQVAANHSIVVSHLRIREQRTSWTAALIIKTRP